MDVLLFGRVARVFLEGRINHACTSLAHQPVGAAVEPGPAIQVWDNSEGQARLMPAGVPLLPGEKVRLIIIDQGPTPRCQQWRQSILLGASLRQSAQPEQSDFFDVLLQLCIASGTRGVTVESKEAVGNVFLE